MPTRCAYTIVRKGLRRGPTIDILVGERGPTSLVMKKDDALHKSLPFCRRKNSSLGCESVVRLEAFLLRPGVSGVRPPEKALERRRQTRGDSRSLLAGVGRTTRAVRTVVDY